MRIKDYTRLILQFTQKMESEKQRNKIMKKYLGEGSKPATQKKEYSTNQ